MANTKSWNPYEAAAEVLQNRKKDIDSASEEKSQKKDDRTKKAEDDPSRDPAEEKELTKSAPRLRDYRIKKSIGGDSPAEVRLYDLQMKRIKSYKKGTKKVAKTGLAKLHKGEAVLNARDAKKYRSSGKVSAAASSLGAGKKKVPSKNQRLIRAAGHELKENPPKVVKSTMRKKGPEAARKQNIAIMLSKARAAGADIPEK
jgi:hypothetical protein